MKKEDLLCSKVLILLYFPQYLTRIKQSYHVNYNHVIDTMSITIFWASVVALMVKNLPTMLKTWVRSLGQEVPLEEGMAIHFSILAWRIP